jgi:predicted amidophosphoribosyltransferase
MAARGLRAAWMRAGEIWFPRRCAGCGVGTWPFCDACRARLVVLQPPWCERCGRPWSRSKPRCADCPPEAIDTARSPFAFGGPARSAVHRLKFSGWRGVADALAGRW